MSDNNDPKFICRYCGSEWESQRSLSVHENFCDTNPQHSNYLLNECRKRFGLDGMTIVETSEQHYQGRSWKRVECHIGFVGYGTTHQEAMDNLCYNGLSEVALERQMTSGSLLRKPVTPHQEETDNG